MPGCRCGEFGPAPAPRAAAGGGLALGHMPATSVADMATAQPQSSTVAPGRRAAKRRGDARDSAPLIVRLSAAMVASETFCSSTLARIDDQLRRSADGRRRRRGDRLGERRRHRRGAHARRGRARALGTKASNSSRNRLEQHLLAAFEIAVDVGLGEAGLGRDGVEAGAPRRPPVEQLGAAARIASRRTCAPPACGRAERPRCRSCRLGSDETRKADPVSSSEAVPQPGCRLLVQRLRGGRGPGPVRRGFHEAVGAVIAAGTGVGSGRGVDLGKGARCRRLAEEGSQAHDAGSDGVDRATQPGPLAMSSVPAMPGCAAMLVTPQPPASLRRCSSRANIRQASLLWP